MIEKLFDDKVIVRKVQKKLPFLFHRAELESSRAGKIGMEVGSMRERILIALLIHKFGENNVQTDLPITEPETDVIVGEEPVSIKTITGSGIAGVKLVWTVDALKAQDFVDSYIPHCDMLLTHINWNSKGGLYLISREQQCLLLDKLGRDNYLKPPKPGTNPRGVEISNEAIRILASHQDTKFIDIVWQKKEIEYNPYERWLQLWEQN